MTEAILFITDVYVTILENIKMERDNENSYYKTRSN